MTLIEGILCPQAFFSCALHKLTHFSHSFERDTVTFSILELTSLRGQRYYNVTKVMVPEVRALRFSQNYGSNMPKKSAGLGLWFIFVGYKENHSS